jgi:thiol-disulfide isomerase/thioredoxin
LAVGLLAIALFGCRPAAGPPVLPAAPGSVQLRVVDERQFAAALTEQRGKVVLVDFWATWCEPCRVLFPHTVELSRRYADAGLAVVTVSLDDLDAKDDVLRFLGENNAQTINFQSCYGLGTRTIEAFQVGRGAIPYLKLYDRQGKVQKIFGLGGEMPEPGRIEASIKQLLGPGGA